MSDDRNYLNIVKKIVLDKIPKDKFNIFLFGSRARRKHRFAADIDIGVQGEIPLDQRVISTIKNEVDESIIPFKVDIIDFTDVSDDFKKVALEDIEIWNKTKFTDTK